jgi:hypothetical protein
MKAAKGAGATSGELTGGTEVFFINKGTSGNLIFPGVTFVGLIDEPWREP